MDTHISMTFEEIVAEERKMDLLVRKILEKLLKIYKEEHPGTDYDYIAQEISSAINQIVESFKFFSFSSIVSDQAPNIFFLKCGYLSKYASNGSSLVFSRTVEALNSCQDLRVKLLQPKLKVVSLGGGPGNCVTGFCRALQLLQHHIESLEPYTCPARKLNLVVVDSMSNWKDCWELAAEYMNRELFRSDTVQCGFCCANIPANLHEIPQSLLKEADVIIMAKFMSAMHDSRFNQTNADISKQDNIELIKDLAAVMKPDALLLLIDSLGARVIPQLSSPDWTEFFDVLYAPSPPFEQYKMLKPAEYRFGFHECVSSNAQIVVFRKKVRHPKSPPCAMPVTDAANAEVGPYDGIGGI